MSYLGIQALKSTGLQENYMRGNRQNIIEQNHMQGNKPNTIESNKTESAGQESYKGELREHKNKELMEAIKKASGKTEMEDRSLEFSIHEETNQIMIKIIDNETQEVVKELPSKKILDIMAKMMEISGNYIDERR